jgi:hypothetical protein
MPRMGDQCCNIRQLENISNLEGDANPLPHRAWPHLWLWERVPAQINLSTSRRQSEMRQIKSAVIQFLLADKE